MKRADVTANGIEYKNRILIENFNDLQEYHENYFNIRVKDSMKQTFSDVKNGFHISDVLGASIMTVAKAKEQGIIYALADTTSKMYIDQLKFINDGYKLAINDNLGYFPFYNDNALIVLLDEVKYTENDIKLNKFEGGKHYYAKIGQHEVIDQWGERKWNTPEYARKIAIEYLNKINTK